MSTISVLFHSRMHPKDEMENIKLAIVIPAYKETFLRSALTSIAAQTCKEFSLYIGDDASPHDLSSVIDEFASLIPLYYTRFDKNLGGYDLVAHWHRCLELIGNEEWIWLFSDDDVMEETCVESFYQELNDYPHYDLFHFNVDIINADGNLLRCGSKYPRNYRVEEFIYNRLKYGEACFAVEFIFRRSVFCQVGGFKNFDLAWGADVATWAMVAAEKGIRTVHGGGVRWRQSNENISPDNSRKMQLRKMYSLVEFLFWVRNEYGNIKGNRQAIRTGLLSRLKCSCLYLTPIDLLKVLIHFAFRVRHHEIFIYCLLYLTAYYPCKRFKQLIEGSRSL